MALDVNGGLYLACNLYRALLAGLTPSKLASALLVGQMYCGLPAYVGASKTLVEVLRLLAERPDGSEPADMIRLLQERFGPSR
jgi:alkylhydroperoxidase/carboxymuconolactone decarboxylase family protein YurZ